MSVFLGVLAVAGLAGLLWLLAVNITGPVRRVRTNCCQHSFSYSDYKGVIHFHTVYSDGAANFAEVLDAAGKLGIDFLVASDHNTLAAVQDGWENWHGNTLLLIGEELSVKTGHLLVFNLGYKAPSLAGQTVVTHAQEQGALSFIAHPYSLKAPWKDWNIAGFTGLEVINFEAMCRWKAISPFGLFGLLLFLCSACCLENVCIANYPAREFKKWDNLARTRRVVGIGGTDAHGFLKVGKKRYKAPSYYHAFQTVYTHILTPEAFSRNVETDRAMIWASLAKGHAYISFDTFASPTGFQFTAQNSEETVIMGDCIRIVPENPVGLHIQLPPGQTGIIRLLRDGELVARFAGGSLQYDALQAGVYRVEVYHYTARLPFDFYYRSKLWIISNPIYIEDQRSR